MSLPPPTPEVERLVQVVGPAAALALVEERGGTRIYVPRAVTPWLSALIGDDAAAALVAAYGGEHLPVPVARRWRVRIYRGRDMSHARIARRVGCSEDTVGRILAGEVTGRQLDLFD